MRKAKILWFLPLFVLLFGSLLAEHSIGPAPLDLYRGSELVEYTKAEREFRGEIVWGIESANAWFASFDSDFPETLTNLGPQMSTGFSNAGDFWGADQSIVHELDNANNFGYYDIATGAYTPNGTIAPPPECGGETWAGIATDPTTGIMYAITTDVATSQLCMIDPATLTATWIGDTGQAGLIALAVDGNGVIYSYCLVSDNFVSLDPGTGASTVIGPLGFNANYGQGMTWNPIDGQVYGAVFNSDTFQPELRVFDVATGSSTMIGGAIGSTDPGGLCQFGWIAIPGDYEPPMYCESTYSNTTDDWITNVTFNTINNDSGQEGEGSYGDYTDISTNVVPDETYTFSMTWESGSWTEYGTVWFDWNRDFDFEDPGEEYQVGSGASVTVTIDITIPTDASVGPTRMRVSERWNDWPDPCNDVGSSYGETEDYTVIVGPPPAYCDAVYSNTTDDWITNVTFNTINNDTGQEGEGSYGDYTDISTEVAIGTTHYFEMTWYSEGLWTECGTVYFDWNGDYDFFDDGEEYQLECGVDMTTGMDITIPANALPGATRMRVIEAYASHTDTPCPNSTYGETEDYTVIITGDVPDFGYIEGYVTLNGGDGDVEDVLLECGGQMTYPDATGFYSFELYPGFYDLDASLDGYYAWSMEDIEVLESTVTTVDITLDAFAQGELPLIEDFDAGLPGDWIIGDYLNDGFTWMWMQSYGGQTLDGTPFMMVDSDAAGSGGPHLIEELWTPILNAGSAGAILVEFDHYYNYLGSPEYAAVDCWDGSTWVNLATYMEDHGGWGAPEHIVLDASAYANDDFQVRWVYDDGDGWMWYWAVDNVHIYEPLFGTVSGYVMEWSGRDPIEDAHVYFDGYEGYTDATGYYEISPVLTGTYDVYVESDYYLDDMEPDVVVTDGGNTMVDFELLWSEIAVDPDQFMVNVPAGEYLDEVMIITNDGPGELEFSCSFMEDTENRLWEIPAFTDKLKRSPYAPSIGLAPPDGVAIMPSYETPVARFTREDMCYGIENANGFFASMDTAMPEVLNYLGPEVANGGFSNAGTFGPDPAIAYALVNNNEFGFYEIESGAYTSLGQIAPEAAGGQTWSGMTYDITTGNYYGVTTDVAASNLYEIDVDGMSSTLIGATGMPGLIDIAADETGTLYAYDLVTDEACILDKDTGAATVLGALGYNANYGQGMFYDFANSIMYLTAFNSDTFQPELRIMDLNTGATSFVGVIGVNDPGGLCQMGWASMPAGAAWISFDPTGGVVDPNGGQFVVVVHFDAAEMTPGEIHTGNIHIGNNSIYQRGDDYLIPVTMIVTGEDSGENDIPLANKLTGNYPNPFNPSTTIGFALKETGNVTLEVYNLKGEKVKTLINDTMEAGNHSIVWNGTDNLGKDVSSGVYFYKMKTGRYTSTKKMILMK
jgi:hypothetical protein